MIFTSPTRTAAKQETAIAAFLFKNLGYAMPTRIRSAAELSAIIAATPAGKRFADQPHASTQVTFFDQMLSSEFTTKIEALSTPTDLLTVKGRELYWRCATNLSESPLWQNARQNPHNLPQGTTRNLRTLAKIADRLDR